MGKETCQLSRAQIIQALKDGNKRFMKSKLKHLQQDGKRRKELTDGQAPCAIVLGCADSRVVPEIIFDKGLGELFVVRVAGNVANTCSIASIEYAVAHLNCKVIIVLGHEGCGAVTEARKQEDNGYNLNMLLANILPAVCACGSCASLESVIKKNARLNAKELTSRSSIIADAEKKKKKEERLKIYPAYYHLKSGRVEFLK